MTYSAPRASASSGRQSAHLERVLQDYVAHSMAERPHRGFSLAAPAGNRPPQVRGENRMPVERRDGLGGLTHEYRWAA